MFTKVLLLSIALMTIAMLAFAIQILFKKNGIFSSISIGKSKEMRKRKIYCVKSEQKIIDKKTIKDFKDKNMCASCEG